MPYSVSNASDFEEKLVEIVSYYFFKEGESRANKVAQSIKDTITRICERPLEYPLYEKTLNKNIHKAVVHKTFIILFEIEDKHIFIHDIYHGKRDLV